MTKTKMSTVAIVTLSVLLAAALAATIVLAAFSFTTKASTTITFAGGLTLEATGITNANWNVRSVANDGTIAGTKLTTTTNQTNGVALESISLKNTSTTTAAKVAVAVVITVTGVDPEGAVHFYVTDGAATTATNTTLLVDSAASTGSINFCGVSGATDMTRPADASLSLPNTVQKFSKFDIAAGATVANVVKIINTEFEATKIGELTGATVVATVYIAAGYNDADLTAALESGAFATVMSNIA